MKYVQLSVFGTVLLGIVGCTSGKVDESQSVGRSVAAIVTPAALEQLTISGQLRVGDGLAESAELDFYILQLALMEQCIEEIKELGAEAEDGNLYADEGLDHGSGHG
jgi:hypothetical protein